MCLLTGPPDDILNLSIPLDTITTCSFVVQWSEVIGHTVCGDVWYTITITEGEELISTNNATITNYHVTGLSDNTVYHVNVTPYNKAGSGNAATETMTTDSTQVYIFYAFVTLVHVIVDKHFK